MIIFNFVELTSLLIACVVLCSVHIYLPRLSSISNPFVRHLVVSFFVILFVFFVTEPVWPENSFFLVLIDFRKLIIEILIFFCDGDPSDEASFLRKQLILILFHIKFLFILPT
jgi:hypothetical protein